MKNRIRFYNTIYFRVILVFGIVFSVLLILVGVVFMQIYSGNVISDYKKQLCADAEQIASNVSDYSMNDEPEEYLNYMDAASAILESQAVDVWVLPNYKSNVRLGSRYVNVRIRLKKLSKGMRKVVLKVIREGGSHANQGYDDIYETDMIRAAAPVYDAGGRMVGVVLLNSVAGSRIDVINSCKRIIIISMLIAWVVSFLVAIFLTRQITVPISRIRQTALTLASGDYDVKTNLSSGGEFGQLGEAMDILSVKLSENERIRDEIEQGRMDFFANVSHELRTPITVIRGYAESLADGYVTDKEKISHSLQRMLLECKTMERLVGDLLTLSKMQNPDFVIEKEPISVTQIFEDVIRSAKVLSIKKNIEIEYHSDDEYAFMMGDYDRLRQMFMIIMDNAIKFSHDGGRVEINISVKDKLKVSIKDYGVGISEEVLPNIFEKFYKSKLRMNEKGSGLGLMIAKQIAVKHDGDISVVSEEGKGSCFMFEFDKIEPPSDM